jgi:adenylate cyclase
VLPFDNIGNGADHAYFADGVVDELITALSRVRGFFVLSRSSSFVYRSRPARDLGQELGVRYVLEGSIRRAGERVRITAKLLDAEQDHHIWADRIDGELQDIFDLQDRITQQVVCAIEPKIRTAELERARHKAPENLDAYDLYLQALPHLYDVSRTSNSEARRLLREAINRDASYALACGLLAFCLQQAKQQGWAERSAELDREGVNLAEVAVRLDPEDPRVLWTAGHVFSTLGRQPTRGRHLIDQSLTSNPNSFPAWCISGWNHIYVGEGRAALLDLERAQRLSPLDPMLYYLYSAFSAAYLNLREYELARHWAERSIQERPRQTSSLRFLAVALAYLGEIDRARGVVASMLELDPALTVTVVAEARTNQTNPEDKARFLEGLRLAGLPE